MIDKNKAISVLENLFNEADSLKSIKFYRSNNELVTWKDKIISAVNNIFEADKEKLKSFRSLSYYKHTYVFYAGMPDTTEAEHYECYLDGLNKAQAYLKAWIDEVNTYFVSSSEESNNDKHIEGAKKDVMSLSCFIVHGQNDEKKLEVEAFIHDYNSDIDCIILHRKANEGKTVIEKFENHSDVDFALCIWSADDEGKSRKEKESKLRARQNVVFETGFFMGKLGRNRVIILYEENVEIPSDLRGLIYIPFKDNWKDDLRKEIDSIYSK